MIEIWEGFGKSTEDIYLEDKSTEKIKEDLLKLRAVKMAFTILSNDEGGTALAVHLLADAFKAKEEDEQRESEEKS